VKALTLTLLASTIATSAFALDTPSPGKADARCRQAEYNDRNIVSLTTYKGRTGIIKLDTPERIEKFGTGSSDDDAPVKVPSPKNMNSQPLHSTLPFWGSNIGKSNIFIISLMPDDVTERTYMIEVEVKPPLKDGQSDTDATYCLQYTYNEQAKQEKIQQAAATAPSRRIETERKKAEARLATDCPFGGDQNWKYLAIGDKSITPTAISDNYNCTAFRFPGNMPKPAIFIADSPAWCDPDKPPPDWYLKAPERAIRADPQDDLLIVHETAAHWRFRMGNQGEMGQENGHVSDSSNCGFNPFRGNPGTGTGTPGVVRQILTSK
jgi:type IV secretory pathway VirB9-like protein